MINANVPRDLAATVSLTCYHCALPVPADANFHAEIAGVARVFCCPACAAVAATIVDSGLQNYYRLRDSVDRFAPPRSDTWHPENSAMARGEDFSAFDQPEFQQRWVQRAADGSASAELLIGGMHCAACAWLIEHQLRRLPGIDTVRVQLGEQRVLLRWQQQQLSLSSICAAIVAIGYQPQPHGVDQLEDLRRQENRAALRRLGVAGIGSMQVGMCAIALYAGELQGIETHWRDLMRWASLLLSIPIVFYAGQPFFSGAWRSLRARHAGMDVPIALAIALGFAASLWATLRGNGDVWYDSVTMFIFLLTGARYLEMRARHFSGRLSHDLLSLLPVTATRLTRDQQQQTIPVDQLQPDDVVLVTAGDFLPADGVLLDARAHVNEAAITGESMPAHKHGGDTLIAGSINGDQPLRLRVTAVGHQLRLHAIQQMSRGAALQKPRVAQLADRLSQHFVWIILALAASTYIAWWFVDPARAFWIMLAVLVVSCPCALGLATPIAIANATTALRRCGLLVAKADVWEELPRVTDIVFDKTGTLSEGVVRVTAVRTCGNRDLNVCRLIASALESGSSHPIACAFRESVNGDRTTFTGAPAEDIHHHAGAGVEGIITGRRYRLGTAAFASALYSHTPPPAPSARGHWLLLADQHEALCWFRIGDRIRGAAPATLARLQRAGYTVHLLSGDHSDAVATLAAALHIPHAIAGAEPEAKLDYVRALQHAGRRVLMVGDGINDIPVLAAANVSIAMTSASQLAKANADCIFLTPRLDRLPLLLEHARRTQKIIYENLLWALLYNLIAVPLAACGLISTWLAALGMSLSSLIVIANALRLLTLPINPPDDN
jgi:Cu2+-exporting ATPase